MATTGVATLRNRSRLLVWATIVWNVVEAIVAVSAGAAAGSVALVGFGLDSTVEVGAAVVALWYLRGVSEERERLALRLIGVSFFVLAAYVVVDATRDLLGSAEPDSSAIGIGLAVASLVVMPGLAWAKRRTGEALGSAALVAEAAETKLCASLAVVLLVGLVLNATVGWWWADPLAAIGIALLAAREGLDAWRGEACCEPGHG